MITLPNRNALDPETARAFDFVLARLRVLLEAVVDSAGTPVAPETPTISEIGLAVGSMVVFTGTTVPSGWLLCNGQAVSRAAYASLYAVVGTAYGVGDGATTFNVPDLRGRFPFGVAASGTGSTLAATFGTIDHVHSGPSHTHTINAPSATTVVAAGAGSTVASSTHTHTADAAGAGNTGTGNPPALAVHFIILAQ